MRTQQQFLHRFELFTRTVNLQFCRLVCLNSLPEGHIRPLHPTATAAKFSALEVVQSSFSFHHSSVCSQMWASESRIKMVILQILLKRCPISSPNWQQLFVSSFINSIPNYLVEPKMLRQDFLPNSWTGVQTAHLACLPWLPALQSFE